ncbi:hypothetical protein [Cytobacillus praedii]|uniref:hypothetical protein n=1 Tax=Cytobacillus praedii TaxID=1742358 RepID=UPI002E225F30|nr:hypothetical protein [Cytobacillus praedii]
MIEIYNIEQETVIKTITVNPFIQKDSDKILQEIGGIYKKFNPLPEKGLLVKIPLDPAIHVANQWVNTLVDELIIFYPEEDEPFILIYDDENSTYFFTVDRKVPEEILFTLLFHH